MSDNFVSIVIPAYNPEFFETALRSAFGQSYSQIEIVVSDQSSSSTIEDICKKYPTVRYYRFENAEKLHQNYRAKQNFARCIQLAKGKFVKYLCDDDVLHPFCVERLLAPMLENEKITLSFSTRQQITSTNQFGQILKTLAADTQTVISGKTIIRQLAVQQINFIGEPTTALFRRDCIQIENDQICFFGRELNTHPDLGIWAICASQGDVSFEPNILSYWRRHEEQSTANLRNEFPRERNWVFFLERLRSYNLLSSKDYTISLQRMRHWFKNVRSVDPRIEEDIEWCNQELQHLMSKKR